MVKTREPEQLERERERVSECVWGEGVGCVYVFPMNPDFDDPSCLLLDFVHLETQNQFTLHL